MRALEYLGAPVSEVLAAAPFCAWAFRRSVEEDLRDEEVWYEFDGRGVEVVCDEDERIRTIFLHRGAGEALSEIPFSIGRREVLKLVGTPARSGSASRIPGLGDRGAWDRFTLPAGSIHIEYRLDRDAIELVTLMRAGTEP